MAQKANDKARMDISEQIENKVTVLTAQVRASQEFRKETIERVDAKFKAQNALVDSKNAAMETRILNNIREEIKKDKEQSDRSHTATKKVVDAKLALIRSLRRRQNM